PPEMTFLKANGPTKFQVKENGRQIEFDPIEGVAPRQILTYTVEVRADKVGNAVFEVQMSAATLSTPVKEQESTNIFQPGQTRTASPAPRTDEPPAATNRTTSPAAFPAPPPPSGSAGEQNPISP